MNKIFLIALLIVQLSGTSCCEALPGQVIIIRHAEKPSEGNHLSLKGKERAAALAPFFLGTPELLKFGPPAALFSQGMKDQASSLRPIHTLEPLAASLHLPLETMYLREDYEKLAQLIKNHPPLKGRSVIISWGHRAIPALANALGAKSVPLKWPEEAFDRLWIITYDTDGKASFQDLPQRLLFGDSIN